MSPVIKFHLINLFGSVYLVCVSILGVYAWLGILYCRDIACCCFIACFSMLLVVMFLQVSEINEQ